MSRAKYLRFFIDGKPVDIGSVEDFPLAINYALEDPQDFQKKTSGSAFDVKIPATTSNDQLGNTFHNTQTEDNSPAQAFRRPRKAVIDVNGYELLTGKAFLQEATHDDRPIDYTYDIYGDNADWIIDLKEATLYDFLKRVNFVFNLANIANSWVFDGTDEALPYVFAPVRYGEKMDEFDNNILPEYLKPSFSMFWPIYWAFKSVGYKIQSDFFDTAYFRRMVMPWTWGSFLNSAGTKLENLKFLAKSSEGQYVSGNYNGVMLLNVDNDNQLPAFDNSNTYTFSSGVSRWTYPAGFSYGALTAHFHVAVTTEATATANSDVELKARWYKNGSLVANDVIVTLNAPSIGQRYFNGIVDVDRAFDVVPGDYISVDFYLHIFDSGLGRGNISATVDTLELGYFTLQLGSTINFENYESLKKVKFLDMFAGVVDLFNLSFKTDPVKKVVYIEPTHPYSLNASNTRTGGYFNGDFIDWDKKQDLSKVSTVRLLSDGERETIFKFKDDSADGLLKVVQSRYNLTLGQGKYVLPDRFQTGKKEVENRFFSPVMHYDVQQWQAITGLTPQMVVMQPENISNTSSDEAQNTFLPKACYYKGYQVDRGWRYNGATTNNFPYMFAVNYQPGGENDPVLSYSDEKIGNEIETPGFTFGVGLLRRFFWQRMAIMRNGEQYETFTKLNNFDVMNVGHREHKIIRSNKWELLNFGYQPLTEQTTKCSLRKWVPISQEDESNTFPSRESVINANTASSNFDTKYQPLKCLPTDIK